MRLLLLTLLAVSPAPAAARIVRYAIDAQHSDVAAQVAFFGVASRSAHFPTLRGGIALDPDHAEAVDLDVEIDARALTASDGLTEERLKGPRFFDVTRFPTIRFTGHRLTMTGDRDALVAGELTAHGLTRPATLQVSFDRPPRSGGPDGIGQLVATATIDRRDFGMTAYPLVVGRAVVIRIVARMAAAR
jgi:polyisoprenoid-binding protein YceI